jgi:hypothetical protein
MPLAIDLFCGLGGWTDAKVPGFRFDGSGKSFQTASVSHTGVKNGGDWFGSGADCSLQHRYTGTKRPGIKLSEVGFNVSMAREVAADLKGAKYERSAEDKRQHIGINRKGRVRHDREDSAAFEQAYCCDFLAIKRILLMRTLLILLIGTITAQAADLRMPRPRAAKETGRPQTTMQKVTPPAEVATPRHIGMP